MSRAPRAEIAAWENVVVRFDEVLGELKVLIEAERQRQAPEEEEFPDHG